MWGEFDTSCHVRGKCSEKLNHMIYNVLGDNFGVLVVVFCQ